ncbi:hypothetical protein ACIQ1J_30645 [Streptomyces sp. NPDC097107]|uniref:effector-associated constant component EACC1 n=1 Tax=Streptomyces sp. NPDC097107 TaxID=3366089 RepID=UPI003817ED18
MEFRIKVECADVEDATAAELTGEFADWLVEDRSVGAHADIRKIRPPSSDGGMSGDAVAWIALATSSGFSVATLVYAHLAFRASLPSRLRGTTRLIVERNGVRATIEGESPEAVAQLARTLQTGDSTPLV